MLNSCIADEPLNQECDILSFVIELDNPTSLFYNAADASCDIADRNLTYAQDEIKFIARTDATISAYPVVVKITDGAQIFLNDDLTGNAEAGKFMPFANGTSVDFSQGPRYFRVESQDGAWHRDYKVSIVPRNVTGGDMFFDFETSLLDPDNSEKFYIWPATDENALNGLFQASPYWCNGNPGYMLSKSSAAPDDYPSVPVFGGGPDGSNCIKMETKDTGSFGKMVGLLMASGSMFNGSFDVANALKKALEATLFGSPFAHKPIRLTFDAKFEPGTAYQDSKGKPVEGLIDEPDAYVVLVRNTDEQGNKVIIDGNNVLTSPYIVGKARLPHNYSEIVNERGGYDLPTNHPIHGLTSEWQRVTLDVEYTQPVDPEILANMGYNLYIGFSSSWQGAYFEGAIGTKFWIDNVRVECED